MRACPWCSRIHSAEHLCRPAKRILDALYARGMSGNMPTIEFPAPIPAEQLGAAFGLGPDTRLVSQLVVQAAVVPAAGVPWPALILTGRDTDARPLPKWLYACEDEGMDRIVALVGDMASLATRTARQQREVVSDE